MVMFAIPPREPNDWLLPPETPPLSSLTLPAEGRRTGASRRWAWPAFAMLLAASAIGVVAQLPTDTPEAIDGFARNRLETQATRLMLEQLPPTPRLADVRRLMGLAHLFCQPARGAGSDSLLTCLGHAVRSQGAYSRMAFRIASRGDSVTALVACPALLVHRRAPSPALLNRARPAIGVHTCWRDATNPADTDWAWTTLSDSARFTVVPVPDAPRMRVESAPSGDTITVVW